MKAHPHAELFPMMTDAELQVLAADIKAREAELIRLIEELWSFDLAKLSEPPPETPPRKGRRAKRSKEPVS